MIKDLDQRVSSTTGVTNVELAKDLSHALADGRELIPPSELLRHARAWFPSISVQAGNVWWREQWRADVEHIRVETPELSSIDIPVAVIRANVEQEVGGSGCKVRP